MEALVEREEDRLSRAGLSFGWKPKAAARILALSTIRDGLDVATLRRLAKQELQIGAPAPDDIADAVKELGWWRDDKLRPPSPDIVAATLLQKILLDRTDMAPEWLWVVLEGSGPELVTRLGRIYHDILIIYGDRGQSFGSWLRKMVSKRPQRARALEFFTGQVPRSLLPFAIQVQQILLQVAEPDPERAARLINISSLLGEAEHDDEALRACREGVAIIRRCSETDPVNYEYGLAGGLNNMANRLKATGNLNEAIKARSEAVDILTRTWDLTKHNPEQQIAGLSMSLNLVSDFGSHIEHERQNYDHVDSNQIASETKEMVEFVENYWLS
jgi:hypothetical protein